MLTNAIRDVTVFFSAENWRDTSAIRDRIFRVRILVPAKLVRVWPNGKGVCMQACLANFLGIFLWISPMRKESKIAGGRVAVYVPHHPHANGSGYVLRYRHVMEQHLGRYLTEDEEVHHINGDELDDSLENLRLMTKSEHARLHNNLGPGEKRRVHDWDRIRELYESGLGYRKIARIINCYKGAVQYACKQMGLNRNSCVMK